MAVLVDGHELTEGFVRYEKPFPHWVDTNLLSLFAVDYLNEVWPSPDDKDWLHERGGYTLKSALMFPHRLPERIQTLAELLYSPDACAELSKMVGIELLPDPWFLEGPLTPRLGGGLHEIHPGGMLKMHVDFSEHPTGLTRALNFLLYLNSDWDDGWGGALELGNGEKKILPRGGTAVVFETNEKSWHGHPTPLNCPPNKTRRSLALYYYRREPTNNKRATTVYRKW